MLGTLYKFVKTSAITVSDWTVSRDRGKLLSELHDSLAHSHVKLSKSRIRSSKHYDLLFGDEKGAAMVRDIIDGANRSTAREAKETLVELSEGSNTKKIVKHYAELKEICGNDVPLHTLAVSQNTPMVLKKLSKTAELLENLPREDKGRGLNAVLHASGAVAEKLFKKHDGLNNLLAKTPEPKRAKLFETIALMPADKVELLLKHSKNLGKIIEHKGDAVGLVKDIAASPNAVAILKHPRVVNRIAGDDADTVKALAKLDKSKFDEIKSNFGSVKKFDKVIGKQDRAEVIEEIGCMKDVNFKKLMGAVKELAASMDDKWFRSTRIDAAQFKEITNSNNFDQIMENSVRVAKLMKLFRPRDRSEAMSAVCRMEPDHLKAIMGRFDDVSDAIKEVPKNERLKEFMDDLGLQTSHRYQQQQRSNSRSQGYQHSAP